MTPWTSFIRGWGAPGRPHTECRPAVALRRPPSSHVKVQLAVSLEKCTLYRTMLRLCLLVLAISTTVRSAPLPSSVHHHHYHEQQHEGIISHEIETVSLTVEKELNLEMEEHHLKELNLETEEHHQLREERAIKSNGQWTNGTIPFSFDTGTLTLVQRNRIIKAMKVWQKKTCIRFVERMDEEYFVKIHRNDAGCNSEVGMKTLKLFKGSGQPMQLSQTNCLQSKDRGKIVHELGHVIGFYHEHQRSDRDNYVEILWDNMIDSKVIRTQYEKVSSAQTLGTKYDYNSIMHYGPLDNSANGNATMIILNERFQNTVGRRTRPSTLDYRQVNLFYTCPELDGTMDESLRRPNLLPRSANDVRSGDSIVLSPNLNSNKTWWLNCSDVCRIDDSAGKKFKQNDVSNCSDLIFEMQKVAGRMESTYIKVGDTVALKHRSDEGNISLVSCSYPDNKCALKMECVIGRADGGKFNEDIVCADDVFIVGALGKKVGDQITHKDRLTFDLPSPPESTKESSLRCAIDEEDSEGECYRLDCYPNDFARGQSHSSDECDQLLTFQLTKL